MGGFFDSIASLAIFLFPLVQNDFQWGGTLQKGENEVTFVLKLLYDC